MVSRSTPPSGTRADDVPPALASATPVLGASEKTLLVLEAAMAHGRFFLGINLGFPFYFYPYPAYQAYPYQPYLYPSYPVSYPRRHWVCSIARVLVP